MSKNAVTNGARGTRFGPERDGGQAVSMCVCVCVEGCGGGSCTLRCAVRVTTIWCTRVCPCVRRSHGRGCCTPQWHTRAGRGAHGPGGGCVRLGEDLIHRPSTQTGKLHAQGACAREVGAARDDRSISRARDRRRSGSDLILHLYTISRPPARRQPVVHLPVGGACANAGHSMCRDTEPCALMRSKIRVVPGLCWWWVLVGVVGDPLYLRDSTALM